MTSSYYCDGVNRRDFLKAGVLGSLSFGLAGLLRAEALGEVVPGATTKNAIFLYLPGGQSHLDTFDLKPDASDVAGEFKPIATNVPGIQISEHLPNLARSADKYCILRSVHHTLAAHAPGQQYMRSGNKPLPSLEYPNYGSVISKEHSAPQGIPPYVSLPVNRSNGGVETAGYLGVAYSSFSVGDDPNSDDFSVRALAAPGGLTLSRIQRRVGFMQKMDQTFRTADLRSQTLDGMDKFYVQAYEILTSEAARKAFDIQSEQPEVRERYGRTPFGQACLLARRLVEAGVRCVSVDFGSWDTHRNNFALLKDNLLPAFDAGLAALMEDLQDRGLMDSTVVWSTGEFGRTPKINGNAGRDHWARAMSMVMAGGGIQGGQVIGKTDDKGQEPVDAPYTPDDAAYSFFHALGIDGHKEYHTPTGRPVYVVRNGSLIRELFG